MWFDKRLKVLDLFSGIGGISLGLENTKHFKTVAFCDFLEKSQRVIKKYWQDVPIYKDVREVNGKQLYSDGVPFPDIICGGFPCQDISLAGHGAGLEGARSGLWHEFHRLIRELQPGYALIENVSALRSRGLDQVLRGLDEIGYDAEWNCIPASYVGAPHRRDRIWILAYHRSKGVEGPLTTRGFGSPGSWGWRGKEDLCALASNPLNEGIRWPKPLVCRVADGLPTDMDRLFTLGNSVIPAIPQGIGQSIAEFQL